MKPKKVLTQFQVDFIKENYLKMTDKEIEKIIGLNPNFLIAYRGKLKLFKKKYTHAKVMRGNFFHVEEKKNWAI